jgi:hypothetical protein
MKVKLDDYKDFNESKQYNKHITYQLKQTYNRCNGKPYTQSSNFEKNNAKTNQLFSPTTNFKMKFGLTWVLNKQNPLQTNGKKL